MLIETMIESSKAFEDVLNGVVAVTENCVRLAAGKLLFECVRTESLVVISNEE